MAKKKIAPKSNTYDHYPKLVTWRAYATVNHIPFDCEKCGKVHAHKTVLLANGSHICWYCWIKKENMHEQAITKPKEMIELGYKNAKKTNKSKLDDALFPKTSSSINTQNVTKSNTNVNSLKTIAPLDDKVYAADNYYDNTQSKFYQVATSNRKRGK